MVDQKQSKDMEFKRLKLISVAYKEASLDTPSFRASVNHFQTKVELLEDWIEKTVGFTENHYNVATDDFSRAQSTFLSQLLPSPIMLSNGFVDNQLYTPWLVENFNRDYAEFSTKLLKTISGLDSGYPNALLELMTNYIEPYKSKRANFEYYQNKHDGMLNQHQAIKTTNPGVTPTSIRENAIQLYEVRKGYLDASLELIGTISEMKLGIDKFVMQIIGLAQLKSSYTFKESGKKVDLMPLINEEFVAYSEWVENSMEAAQSLQLEMENAKRQVLKSSTHRFAPSRDLNDYNFKGINNVTLHYNTLEAPKDSPEKAGWLYMKTSLSSPQREIWVRRWCFLKNSVFGIFLLSLSKTYVEETDKFGIFLISVEYDPAEDRKFCFVLKIVGNKTAETDTQSSKDLKLTLQAESLEELKSWLKAFALSRKYASKLEPNSLEYDMAFKRFPPDFFEFASSTTTSMDLALTSFSAHTKPLVDILDESLTGNASTLSPEGKLCYFSMAVTPMATKLTQVAILANFYRKGNWLPNAVIANMWGSSDWSGYAIFDKDLLHLSNTKSTRFEKNTGNEQTPDMKYPEFYPAEMKVSDIQFKSLFFSIDERLYKFPDDLLLFNFSGFWCPNRRQKFSATCYVTANHLYCYMNSMGFINLTSLNLKDLVSIEVGKSSGNVIKIYNTEGLQLRMYVYFKDHRMIAEKLQFVLENKTRVNPRDEQEIFEEFEQIDQKYREKAEEEQATTIEHGPGYVNRMANDVNTTFWLMSATAAECFNRSKELQKKSSITYQHTYDVSPKTLMHMLFGDQSSAFPRSFFLANRHHPYNYISEWKEEKSPDGKPLLVREIKFGFSITDHFLGDANYRDKAKGSQGMVRQKISKMLEGKFYEVDQDPFIVKVVFCHPLRVTAQYLIMQPHETDTPLDSASSSGSLMFVYYKLEFIYENTGEVIKNLSYLERIVLKWAFKFSQMEYIYIKKIIRYYMDRIGTHGKLIKAVKMCGKIGVLSFSDNPNNKGNTFKEEKPGSERSQEALVVYNFSIVLRIILKSTLYRIVNFTFICLRAIVSFIFLLGSGLSHINKTLTIALVLSIGFNILLFGRSTITYWMVRRAERAKNTFHNVDNGNQDNIMQRAIFIKDLDLLTIDLAYEEENLPFKKFKEINKADDYLYRDTRQQVAFRRNELLVELKILQNIEKELVKGDYRKFLLAEQTQCEMVENGMKDIWHNSTELRHYCEGCRMELERLTSLLL